MKRFCLETYVKPLCFVMIFTFVCCSKNDTIENGMEQAETVSIAQEILQLVNAHRSSIGKSSLSFSDLANSLAYEHTLYMIEQRDISHDNFNERANTLFGEGNANNVGENVAYGQRNAKAVMEAWLNSSGHRENIEGDFTHIGIAVVKNSSGTYYFTQLFFRERSNSNNV